MSDIETPKPTPKHRGRPASPLLAATRAYDKAHRDAAKARATIARYQTLIDTVADLEQAEEDARVHLQKVMGDL